MGGEEFAAVLPYTDCGKAHKTAELVSAAGDTLNIEHKASPVTDHITMSIGLVSVKPEMGITLEQLMEETEKAMYTAKKLGRKRIVAKRFK